MSDAIQRTIPQPDVAVTDPSPASSMPAWFQKKRALKELEVSTATLPDVAQLEPELPIILDFEDDSQSRPWKQRLLLWICSAAASGYGISLIVHTILVGALSIVVFHPDLGNSGFPLISLVNQPDENDFEGFDAALENHLEFEGGATNSPTTVSPRSVLPSDLDLSDLSLPDFGDTSDGSEGSGEGDASGNGNGAAGGGFNRPKSGRVVTKGSFTVWTVPEDPSPGQHYLIVIQVHLKKGQRLRLGDVTGNVVGTDNFRLIISKYTSKQFGNQVVVGIPGAAEDVRDTIRVHSRMLRESQQLEISF